MPLTHDHQHCTFTPMRLMKGSGQSCGWRNAAPAKAAASLATSSTPATAGMATAHLIMDTGSGASDAQRPDDKMQQSAMDRYTQH